VLGPAFTPGQASSDSLALSARFTGLVRRHSIAEATEVLDMSRSLFSLDVIGLHPVSATETELREAVTVQWGEDLSGEQLCRAEGLVREHFARLYLLEIEVKPADAEVNWSAITQPIEGQPPENWQTPYDESRLDGREGHWAFFFHFLDRNLPLQTELGERRLPQTTPIPPHLRGILYELPG
jgi:hypothetical protein